MRILFFIKSQSVIIYFFLTFLISWSLIAIIAGPGNIPIDTDKSQEILPLLYVSMLFGPSVAGVLMIGLLEGKNGFRRLKSRCFTWRVKIWYYIVALFGTPLLATFLLLILSFLFPEFQITFHHSDNMAGLIFSGIMAGIMVGIFEELGWTGFVIPRLALRYNILTCGFIVGVLWGLWHFILFWENDSFYGVLFGILVFSYLWLSFGGLSYIGVFLSFQFFIGAIISIILSGIGGILGIKLRHRYLPNSIR